VRPSARRVEPLSRRNPYRPIRPATTDGPAAGGGGTVRRRFLRRNRWEPSLIQRIHNRYLAFPTYAFRAESLRPTRGRRGTLSRVFVGEDSQSAAVASIADKEWERNAKPRRGGSVGGSPRGMWGTFRLLSWPLFLHVGGSLFSGGGPGGVPPRGDRCPRRP